MDLASQLRLYFKENYPRQSRQSSQGENESGEFTYKRFEVSKSGHTTPKRESESGKSVETTTKRFTVSQPGQSIVQGKSEVIQSEQAIRGAKSDRADQSQQVIGRSGQSQQSVDRHDQSQQVIGRSGQSQQSVDRHGQSEPFVCEMTSDQHIQSEKVFIEAKSEDTKPNQIDNMEVLTSKGASYSDAEDGDRSTGFSETGLKAKPKASSDKFVIDAVHDNSHNGKPSSS